MKKAISILLLTLITKVFSAQSQEYSFSEKYNVDVPAQLSVNMEDGNISVYSSDEPGIRVNFIAKINKKLIKIDREELEKHYAIEITKTQNSIAVKCKPTNNENNKKWENRIILSFEVMVPIATSCDLYTVDGNISLNNLQANQKCKTDDGNIHLSSIKGTVSATTNDGNVSFTDIEGELKALTYDGNLSGSLSVLTENISVSTRDGDIKVTLPKGQGMDLDLRGDEIVADLNDFNGTIDDEYIKGKLNGGGTLISISTSDGNLSLYFK